MLSGMKKICDVLYMFASLFDMNEHHAAQLIMTIRIDSHNLRTDKTFLQIPRSVSILCLFDPVCGDEADHG